MIFNTDEEIQSTNSRSLIERESLNSKFVLCLEPGYGTSGALKTARKGVGPTLSGLQEEPLMQATTLRTASALLKRWPTRYSV